MADRNVIVRGNETYFDREISKEQYDAAMSSWMQILPKEECEKVLTEAERYGYGATASSVYEHDGKYYVRCHRYNNCD